MKEGHFLLMAKAEGDPLVRPPAALISALASATEPAEV
jgi:hypothetical protein